MTNSLKSKNVTEQVIFFWGLPKLSCDSVRLISSPKPETKFKIPIFLSRKYKIFWTDLGRLVIHKNGGCVLVRREGIKWTYLISCHSEMDCLEVGKLCYLSSYGMIQELGGSLRLHAAGIESKGRVKLFFGRPGAGKSTLSHFYLEQSNRNLLSDELCFFNGKEVWGAPLKIHIKDPDGLVAIPLNRRAIPMAICKAYILSLPDRKISVRPLSSIEKMKFIFELIVGFGLHQMICYHLSLPNFSIWAKIFFVRVNRIDELISSFELHKLSVPFCRKK